MEKNNKILQSLGVVNWEGSKRTALRDEIINFAYEKILDATLKNGIGKYQRNRYFLGNALSLEKSLRAISGDLPSKEQLEKVHEHFSEKKDIDSIAVLVDIFSNDSYNGSVKFPGWDGGSISLKVADETISEKYGEILDEIKSGNPGLYEASDDEKTGLEREIEHLDYLQQMFEFQTVRRMEELNDKVQETYEGLLTQYITSRRVKGNFYGPKVGGWSETQEPGLDYAIRLKEIINVEMSPEVVQKGFEYLLSINDLENTKKLMEHTGIKPDKEVMQKYVGELIE